MIVVLLMTASACRKEGNKNDELPAREGVKRPVGELAGPKVTKLIDQQGGSITDADGLLTVEIPAGALSVATEISVQPISNTNLAGKGKGFRIGPENIELKKPAKVRFAYGELAGDLPVEVLGIAYQNAEGVWMAMGLSAVDKTNKTITVETSHFSDWDLFAALFLIPEEASVNTGGQVALKAVNVLSIPSIGDIPAGKELPIGDFQEIPASWIKAWDVHNEGDLVPLGANAVYKAPASVPSVNPVAVTVELNHGKGTYLLVSNIQVMGDEGIYLRVDDGAWIVCDYHTTIAQYFPGSGTTAVSGYVWINGSPTGKRVEIEWKGQTTGTYSWDLPLMDFLYSVPGTTLNDLYTHEYKVGYSYAYSPGNLTITKYGKPGEFVEGTFLLTKSGVWGDGGTTHKIDGKFKAKRQPDN